MEPSPVAKSTSAEKFGACHKCSTKIAARTSPPVERIASAIACAACRAAFQGAQSFTFMEPDQSTIKTTFVCGACLPLIGAGIAEGGRVPARGVLGITRIRM